MTTGRLTSFVLIGILSACGNDDDSTSGTTPTGATAGESTGGTSSTATPPSQAEIQSSSAAITATMDYAAEMNSVNEGVRGGVRAGVRGMGTRPQSTDRRQPQEVFLAADSGQPTADAVSTCPKVTPEIDLTKGTFTYTIDFSTGCTTADGKTVSGKVVSSGSVSLTGLNYTTTLTDLSNGTRSVSGTNTIVVGGGKITSDMNGSITEAGETKQVKLNQTLTQSAGTATPLTLNDDIFTMNLTGTVTLADGTSSSVSISEANYAPGTCTTEPSSGSITVTQGITKAEASFGSCDACVTLTINGFATNQNVCWAA